MNNKKGFVLIESIVTAVFVMGFFTFLIANLLPMVAEYEKTLDYDSIESKYAAHLIRKMILKDNSCRTKNLVSLSSNGYYTFEDTDLCLYLENSNYCNNLLGENFLDVKKIILTDYNTTTIKSKTDDFDRVLGEYIRYIPKYASTVNTSAYAYSRRLIILFNDGRVTNIELLMNFDNSLNCGGATC